MIAQKQAIECRTNLVRPVHVALGCVAVDGNVRRMLESLNRREDIENLLIDLTMQPGATANEPPVVVFSPIAQSGVDLAHEIANDRCKRAKGVLRKAPVYIQTLDLLAGTMQKSVQISAAFKDLDVSLRNFMNAADYMPMEDCETPAPVGRARPRIFALLGLAGKQ